MIRNRLDERIPNLFLIVLNQRSVSPTPTTPKTPTTPRETRQRRATTERQNDDDIILITPRPLVDINLKLTPYSMQQHIFCSFAHTIFFLLGCLARHRRCSAHPDAPMNLVENDKAIEGWLWMCSRPNCKKEVSVRKNSFFAGSHLALRQIIIIAYNWFYRRPQKGKNKIINMLSLYQMHRTKTNNYTYSLFRRRNQRG